MPAAPRKKIDPLKVQPPRPPNAWIIYRTENQHNIPPPAPGEPPHTQAVVSRILGARWKKESPQVKAEYERRAEEKKAEHHIKFPDYTFKPLKKEEKERLREERRRLKSEAKRAGPSQNSQPTSLDQQLLPSSLPVASDGFLYPMSQPTYIFGAAGPSPPMSAASSPAYGSSGASSHGSTSYSMYPSPSTSAVDGATVASSSTQGYPHGSSEWSLAFQQQASTSVAANTESLQNQENLTISMPPISGFSNDPEFQQFLLDVTDNPEIFQVNQPLSFIQDPDSNELEVQMSRQLQAEPVLLDNFSWNWNTPNAEFTPHSSADADDLQQYFDLHFEDLPAVISEQACYLPANEEGNQLLTPGEYYPSTPAPDDVPHNTVYQPPPGAAQSSSRRVGGSWRKPPSPEQRLPWGVPAS